jgi:hypothetical protein
MCRQPRRRARVRLPGLVRAGVVVLALAPAVAPAPAGAAAPRTARVCASHALLVETPGGAVTGIVHHFDLVRVLEGHGHATWWRVLTSFGTRGWLHRHDLCGHRR